MKIKVLTALVVLAVVFAAVSHIGTVGASAKVPEIVLKKSFLNETADHASITTLTAPVNGATYFLSYYGSEIIGGGSGQVSVDYTDDQGIKNATSQLNSGNPALIHFLVIHAAPSTTISVSTFNTQSSQATTYNLYVTIEEL